MAAGLSQVRGADVVTLRQGDGEHRESEFVSPEEAERFRGALRGWHAGDVVTPLGDRGPARVVIVFPSGNIIVRYDESHAFQWLDRSGLPMPPERRR